MRRIYEEVFRVVEVSFAELTQGTNTACIYEIKCQVS